MVVVRMWRPMRADLRTLLGFSTISWRMAGGSGFVRDGDEMARFNSGKVAIASLKSEFEGGGSLMPKGMMLMSGMTAAVSMLTVPWATIAVPCGIEAMRTTLGGTAGSVVSGTMTQIPGSMCNPDPLEASEICWR